MRNLLFFSRVAFICNLCFGCTFLLRLSSGLQQNGFTATIVVLGYPVSVVLNLALHGVLLTRWMIRKPVWKGIPAWLLVVNLLFFIAQLIFLLR